jgi:hypothetical protein
MKVSIDKVRLDGGTQFRKTLLNNKIYEYKEAMEEGAKFPLISVRFDGSDYWLSDGFHRYHALKLLEMREIEVDCKSGTREDAVWDALAANGNHGIALTVSEKINKVKTALSLTGSDKKSNYAIAKACVVSEHLVARIRNPELKSKYDQKRHESAVRKSQQNQENQIDTENSGKKTTDPISNKLIASGENVQVDEAFEADEEELLALKLEEEMDRKFIADLMDADDKFAKSCQEVKRLQSLNAKFDARIKSLMNEKNAALKQIKALQKTIDRLERELGR